MIRKNDWIMRKPVILNVLFAQLEKTRNVVSAKER
jgi:hypothetical protein